MVKVIHISDNTDLQEAFRIRENVFVEEQHVDPELEYDEHEGEAEHYLALYENKPAGTARWRYTDKGIKLERFAVLKGSRQKGIGAALVREVLKDVVEENAVTIYLHAQMPVISFYEKLGFEAKGEIFEEAGILHRIMYYLPG